jgi:sugar lactone lactonase YvrE
LGPEEAFAALVDGRRFAAWCTLHREWHEEPAHLDSGSFTETISLLGRPAQIAWTADRQGSTRLALHGDGPRGMRAELLASAEARGAGSTVSLSLAIGAPTIDATLSATIDAWLGDELALSLARFGDVCEGRTPRENLSAQPDTAVLIEGFGFTECPRWHGGALYFVDMVTGSVHVDPDGGGSPRQIAEVPHTPGGLGWLPNGHMLVVSQRDRRILRDDGTSLSTHADLSTVATSPLNDMLVDTRGRAYVGEMGFDIHALIQAEEGDEQVEIVPGAIHVVEPDGALGPMVGGIAFPNGIVLTNSGRTLVVAESIASSLAAIDVHEDGRLGARRSYAELRHLPDGITVDRDDHIWVAAPVDQCALRVNPHGEVVGQVRTTQDCLSVELGGEDGHTLFCCTSPTNDHRRCAELMRSRIETVQVEIPRR